MVKEHKVSCCTKILEVLSRHPKGLNAAKVRQLVAKEYPASEQHIASMLSQLTHEGRVLNDGRNGCPSCAKKSTIYKHKPSINGRESEHA